MREREREKACKRKPDVRSLTLILIILSLSPFQRLRNAVGSRGRSRDVILWATRAYVHRSNCGRCIWQWLLRIIWIDQSVLHLYYGLDDRRIEIQFLVEAETLPFIIDFKLALRPGLLPREIRWPRRETIYFYLIQELRMLGAMLLLLHNYPLRGT
jgi:hypothetical protein